MSSQPEVAPRRERVRRETTAEIKDRAWTLMAESGHEALSLREIARQMGMTPSALYRYFASRDDLLTALIVDGYNSLADDVHAAHDAVLGETPDVSGWDMFLRLSHVYRAWTLNHRTQYLLIFATSIPGYQGSDETLAAATRTTGLLVDVMARIVERGEIDLERADLDVDDTFRAQLQQWSGNGGLDLPPPALAAAMRCYIALHGLVHLEANDHFPRPVQDSEAMFDSIMRATIRSLSV